MSIQTRLDRYHRGREPERLAIKYRKMAQDPLAFFRGSPNLFYEDWKGKLDSPRVWLCGDLHLENFGTYRGDNRCTYFDFNDFDEACLGPVAWDLTRLLTSMAIEAGEREWRKKEIEAFCAGVADSYAEALVKAKVRWVERETAKGIVHDLFRALQLRGARALLDKRTELVRRRRVLRTDGVKALPLAAKSDARLLTAFAESLGGFRYLDAARRIAGNSSLGIPRFVLLVEDRRDDFFLLDLKQARPPVALRFHPKERQPEWESEAHRVVGVQSMVQAISPAFLRPVKFEGEWWVLRELMPSDDRVDVAQATKRGFIEHAASLGEVVAWGHLRSSGRRGSATADELVAFGEKRSWRHEAVRYAVEYASRARDDWESFRRGAKASKV